MSNPLDKGTLGGDTMKHANGCQGMAALTLLTAFLTISCERDASLEDPAGTPVPTYLPEAGNRVLMTTHRFSADNFESGKRTVIEEFGKAMQASGQTRRTYFLDDPESHVVVEVSFFHPDSDVDEWLGGTHRQQAVDIATPFYREPLDVRRLEVESVHDTPVEASYLPRPGNRVIIFTHRFTPGGYEEGKRIVPERFGSAMEASAQTRRTYFTDDPQTQTMLSFSFFHNNSSPDEWLENPERREVLDVVEPLLREPIDVYHLTVEAVHDTTNR
jgi:hypothetical protein